MPQATTNSTSLRSFVVQRVGKTHVTAAEAMSTMTFAATSTYYACPCSDLTAAPAPPSSKRASIQPSNFQIKDDDAFNSHSARANYALYPLEHLLYCDECDAIRCPRCWTEETLYWYCPSCLFEVPSSAVRSDGNR